MGGLATEAEAPALDVSAEGTLLWLRRPNGSWWPSIVISPLDVPDGCAAPPRCPTTPIMLLGRRDGATFVEWCNLDKCKRVKPFRCGELDFDQRITNAQALAAARIRGSTTKTYNKCRYARMEDAIIQALQIERARALEAESKSRHGDTCSAKPNKGNGVTTKSCSPHAAARDSSTVVQPPLPKRKRKTPYDSEDDAPTGSRRMRDLSDIGSKTVPMELSNAGTISVLNHDLPSVSQVKRSKQSPHSTAKRRHATADQDQPCGGSRKKDRSRPLSELCNGDMWNGFRSNGQKAHEQIMGVGTCPTSSSGTSSLGTSLDKTSSHHSGAFKTDQAKGTEISCMTGLLKDDFRHGDDAVETPRTAGSILEEDHLRTYQPFALTKYPTWKHNKKSTDYSKADKSSQCESGNFKVKTIITVDQEGNNGTRDALEHEHHETRAVKHKALSTGVVLLEKKPAKRSLNKPAEPGVNMHLAVFPADSDCVGAVQQQRSERKRDREESSETKSNGSNFENGSRPNLVFELPLQVLRPQQRALDLERFRAVKPMKTLQLNSTLYDVELCVQGSSNKARRVPLVSLMSKWNRRPVVGYPVSVEVSDDVFCRPLSNTNDHQPATSGADRLLKDKAEGLQCLMPSPHTCRAKPKSHRKTSGKEVDKLWQPHTKKPASSPRKMRRLSSFASSHRDGDKRQPAVGKVSGPTIAYIPLRVVFSRINEALSFPVK